MTDLTTAARRSTRRWNPASDEQRGTWISHYIALLIAGGMDVEDAWDAKSNRDWDGMDTPRMAADRTLAGKA